MTTGDIHAILNDISFENTIFNFDWKFHIETLQLGCLIQVSFVRPDTETGEPGRGYSRKEFVSHDVSRSSVVKTAWVLIHMTIHHELMEGFRWRGCRIFNPHHTVEELASLEKGHSPATNPMR